MKETPAGDGRSRRPQQPWRAEGDASKNSNRRGLRDGLRLRVRSEATDTCNSLKSSVAGCPVHSKFQMVKIF